MKYNKHENGEFLYLILRYETKLTNLNVSVTQYDIQLSWEIQDIFIAVRSLGAFIWFIRAHYVQIIDLWDYVFAVH